MHEDAEHMFLYKSFPDHTVILTILAQIRPESVKITTIDRWACVQALRNLQACDIDHSFH